MSHTHIYIYRYFIIIMITMIVVTTTTIIIILIMIMMIIIIYIYIYICICICIRIRICICICTSCITLHVHSSHRRWHPSTGSVWRRFEFVNTVNTTKSTLVLPGLRHEASFADNCGDSLAFLLLIRRFDLQPKMLQEAPLAWFSTTLGFCVCTSFS